MKKLCENCEELVDYNPYFQAYICRKCNHSEEHLTVTEDTWKLQKRIESLEKQVEYLKNNRDSIINELEKIGIKVKIDNIPENSENISGIVSRSDIIPVIK